MRGIILLLVIITACGCGRADAEDNCDEWMEAAVEYAHRMDACELDRAVLRGVLCHDERRLEYCSGE